MKALEMAVDKNWNIRLYLLHWIGWVWKCKDIYIYIYTHIRKSSLSWRLGMIKIKHRFCKSGKSIPPNCQTRIQNPVKHNMGKWENVKHAKIVNGF